MCGLVEAASCYGIKVFILVRFFVSLRYVLYGIKPQKLDIFTM